MELSVIDYEKSVRFYDRMFGWLGYRSFWTLDVGYCSTYYMARFPFFHSYIGIQPAQAGGRLDPEKHATGIHHVALWARSRREVDAFHRGFLEKERLTVTDPPAEYPVYAPGYYAVFFNDPTGIHWELAYTPRIPMPWDLYKSLKLASRLKAEHPEWRHHPATEMWRDLPSRREMS